MTLDGEVIQDIEPVFGYLHRGTEKLAEERTYTQNIPFTDRADYLAAMTGNLGLAIAVYHNLLYYGVLPESAQPCRLGVSCTTRQIEWLGFITIPLMSLVAFSVINVCMGLYGAGKRYFNE